MFFLQEVRRHLYIKYLKYIELEREMLCTGYTIKVSIEKDCANMK